MDKSQWASFVGEKVTEYIAQQSTNNLVLGILIDALVFTIQD